MQTTQSQTGGDSQAKQLKNLELENWEEQTDELEAHKIIRSWVKEDAKILVFKHGEEYAVKKVTEDADPAREAYKQASTESFAIDLVEAMAAGKLNELMFGGDE